MVEQDDKDEHDSIPTVDMLKKSIEPRAMDVIRERPTSALLGALYVRLRLARSGLLAARDPSAETNAACKVPK
jgi:hypothetical protein